MAKKSLGQNFLTSHVKIKKIVDALDLKEGDFVIEVGPGHGELTGELVNPLIGRLVLIEKDDLLAEMLREKYTKNKKVEVINGDALKVLPNLINQLINSLINYKLVGNIPYYITGYLFRIIGDLENKPSAAVFTIQKEVAERMSAKAGEMNLLAASVQFWADVKIITTIPKKFFRPVPKVDSAVIKLETRDKREVISDDYYKFIKVLFKQPRKTILNNLQPIIKNKQILAEKLKNLKIDLKARPEDLSMEQVLGLFRNL